MVSYIERGREESMIETRDFKNDSESTDQWWWIKLIDRNYLIVVSSDTIAYGVVKQLPLKDAIWIEIQDFLK